MAATLLHLVDQYGQPVPPQVRLAVGAAYRWAEREYERFDRAVLAEMAEALAVAMCRHQDRIELPRRYAVAALAGKLQEWYRAHPAVEVMLQPEDLEQVIQAGRILQQCALHYKAASRFQSDSLSLFVGRK